MVYCNENKRIKKEEQKMYYTSVVQFLIGIFKN